MSIGQLTRLCFGTVYRTLSRLIRQAREIDPEAVGSRRLLDRRAKRLYQKMGRLSANEGRAADRLKPLYSRLIRMVEDLFCWARSVRKELAASRRFTSVMGAARAEAIVQQIDHFIDLGQRVVGRARRRVLDGESVPNDEKLFSIFEPHTELLKRGKAGKNVEFGHMVQIQQVDGKFITDYDVFEKRPVEHGLVDSVLESHKKLFGDYPDEFAGDKGYYKNMDAIHRLERKIPVVSIGKKGRRTREETAREHGALFRLAQRFRAGIEGTIAFLKRMLRLARCFNKGWEHFVSTIGQTILAHNLLVLARC